MTYFDTSLEDKFDLDKTRIYTSGTQALVRLCLMQAARDRVNGLDTGGYITGYRGSPLGGLDQQFGVAKKQLTEANVIFEAGLNEDIAATAIWGTQQAELRGDGKHDGVFAMWYGKGPGVDRTGDVFRHANLAGTSKNGGVLVLMGDDHTCESSTTAHQSEYALRDAMIPILNPANISEIIEYGLHGWALSRFSGLWCGLKGVKDNIESSGTVDVALDAIQTRIPTDYDMPEGGLNIRLNDPPVEQEARLHQHKLNAVRAYVRENQLNKVVYSGGKKPKIGIVSTGKSYLDVLQAFEELGIDEKRADQMGLALYKVAMPWPLEPTGILDFAKSLDQVIVVEEKRGLMEGQIKSILYDLEKRPNVIGKTSETGETLFQVEYALTTTQIAAQIGTRLLALKDGKSLENKVSDLKARMTATREELPVTRGVAFCAGCPHNSSTVLPEGSRGFAGIGCHYMAQFMDRNVEGYTHMGGEGANWIGESKFSKRDHVFQNLGDGTYNHSGLMSLRGAVAFDTNITYKILYNDAVAMTGGQAHEGGLGPYDIVAEVLGAGVKKLAYVTDDISRIDTAKLPANVDVYHRRDVIKVQEDLAQVKGVTVLLYDQTCATEKRRRIKRNTMEDVNKRLFINPDVCEGCGDCGVQSNCVALQPLETPLGRKRRIDQSACNKDFSCQDGFCPSFVSVKNGTPRKPEAAKIDLPDLPEPSSKPALETPYSILVTGIGGTGVVTISALLGMAAHLDGKGSGLIDMAGLAQKGGSVFSHVKLANSSKDVKSIRVAEGTADLLLGCDVVVSAGNPALSTLSKSSHVMINTHEQMPKDFTLQRDFTLPTDLMHDRIVEAVDRGNAAFVDATRYAIKLLGNSIGANLFMLGVAYQKGLIPLTDKAIMHAIKLNGVAIKMNQNAFTLGRHWVIDPARLDAYMPKTIKAPELTSLDEIIADRVERLTAYQNAAYAKSYSDFMAQVADKPYALAVAKNLFKLMAYKDEYEVARLYSEDSFMKNLKAQFEGDLKLKIALAPPLLCRPDPVTGKAKKIEFGPWIFKAFSILKRFKGLRGTALDPFGYTAERKMERALVEEYKETVAGLDALDPETAQKLAELPNNIRGFGHVKLASIKTAQTKKEKLLTSL
ncbi:indolepyruvate ferredoxin oxidoreductase family protein [Amylibacter sp. SFDW26]|uniref:indolepyruvate ferredoxin oxidoreductase family protein n=1 Tax=Amylibacter sp. SFDW26 TaxID=2652722 RepID=UPI0012614862|nr:indolepyruvate ferredoxin oxidoreductase family protein [Amylibacter sp. SFDW26]KAB7614510.1 indolepyruvate ferredoxin oxidoreductase family protein [Amylibacter sp. SFDW26]